MKYIGIIIFVIYLFAACNGKSTNETSIRFQIDYNNLNELKLSKFVENIKVIKLQMDKNHIIGQILKVQIYNDNIYILDQRSNMLFIYDMTGNFVNTLNKIGQGPDEYLRIIDFDVNENGIYIVDFPSHSVKCYDFDLKLINKISFSLFGFNILAKDHSIWLYNEYSVGSTYFRLYQIDNDANILSESFKQEALDREPKYNWTSSNVFQKYRDEYYYSDRYDNTVFQNNQNDWNEYIKFSFGDKTFPTDKRIFDYDIYGADFPFILRRNLFITEQYVVIDFMYSKDLYHSFYNRNDKSINSGKMKNDIISDYNRFAPRWSSSDYLIETVEAEYVLNEKLKGLITYEKSLSDLKVDDNPILVLYSLKR
jgi:hypothetical protein